MFFHAIFFPVKMKSRNFSYASTYDIVFRISSDFQIYIIQMEEMRTLLVPDIFCRANSFINCTIGEEKNAAFNNM